MFLETARIQNYINTTHAHAHTRTAQMQTDRFDLFILVYIHPLHTVFSFPLPIVIIIIIIFLLLSPMSSLFTVRGAVGVLSLFTFSAYIALCISYMMMMIDWKQLDGFCQLHEQTSKPANKQTNDIIRHLLSSTAVNERSLCFFPSVHLFSPASIGLAGSFVRSFTRRLFVRWVHFSFLLIFPCKFLFLFFSRSYF